MARKDDILLFATPSAADLGNLVSHELGSRPGAVECRTFYNGDTFVRIGQNVRERDVFLIQSSTPPINDRLMELMMLIDAARGASARRVTAVLPHFPYQQSDKKDQPRICITAKLVCNLLSAAGVDRLLTIDLHAPQLQGFSDRPCDQLTAIPILCDYFQRLEIPDAVAVATDVGRAQMVRRYARRLKMPLAVIDKERTGETTVRALHIIGDVQNRNAILFDDLIGTGGSLIEAARLLREHGARDIYAGAVHGVLAGDAIERLEQSDLRRIVITDTVPVQNRLGSAAKFEVLSVAPILAQAIRHIHVGESVSALFT